ncbi:MAG: hypothetical protein O2803_14230, partial [Chloroflexi bacterium]|nr:hypothetical protein [Chloroflexota bacterium]
MVDTDPYWPPVEFRTYGLEAGLASWPSVQLFDLPWAPPLTVSPSNHPLGLSHGSAGSSLTGAGPSTGSATVLDVKAFEGLAANLG